MPTLTRTPTAALALAFAFTLALTPAPAAAQEDEDGWDVEASLGPSKTLAFTTSEGTWMNVDVSPDGRTLVFDLLGDLYSMPATGGRATRLTSGAAGNPVARNSSWCWIVPQRLEPSYAGGDRGAASPAEHALRRGSPPSPGTGI